MYERKMGRFYRETRRNLEVYQVYIYRSQHLGAGVGGFAFLQYVVFKSMNTTPVTDNAVLHFLGIQYKGYMYSYAISAVIGYAAAYVMNRKLTFQADANPVLSTILYTIMVVCTIAFNTWFGAYLGTIVTNHHWDSVFITLLTKLLVMTVPTLWTYPLNRFVIHRKKKAKVEPLPESADTPAGAVA